MLANTVFVELMSYMLEGGSSVSSDKVVLLQKNVEELKQKVKQRNNQLKEKDMMIGKLVQRMKKMKMGGGMYRNPTNARQNGRQMFSKQISCKNSVARLCHSKQH